MKNRVIRLNESDLEKLVQKIIKEEGEENVTTSSLKKDVKQTSTDLGSLAGLEKQAVDKLTKVIQKLNEPGNQVSGNAKNLLGKLFKEFGV